MGVAAPILGTAANAFLPGSGGIVSGILGGIGGSGQQPSQGTPGYSQSSQTVWGPQGKGLEDLYGRGKSFVDQYGQLSQAEQGGVNNIQNYYTNGLGGQVGNEFAGTGRGLAQQGYDTAQNFLTQQGPQAGIDMNVMGEAQNNPYATATMDAMAGDVTRNLQRNILPSIRNQAGGRGLVGSTRAGVAEGLASSDATKQISDNATRYRENLYNNALQLGGQFGMNNAQIQNNRQLQQAQLGSQLGGAGMGYLGSGVQMGGTALDKYLQASGYGRGVAGDVLGQYGEMLGRGPTTLSSSYSSGGTPPQQTEMEGILGGAAAGLGQYNQNARQQEQDLMNKYKYGQGVTGGTAGYEQWKAQQPSPGLFGGMI